MNTFVTALAPVLVLISIGFWLKKIDFLSLDSWAGIEKLTYFVLFPALLINSLAQQSIQNVPWATIFLVAFVTLTITTLTLMLWHRIKPFKHGAIFTSVFQGGIRFNTYITFSISYGLFGEQGLALASITAGFMIVFVNIASVYVFLIWGKTAIKTKKEFLRTLFFNPLIIACVIGWSLSLSNIGLSGIAQSSLEVIGRAALPLGLLAVGAALKLEAVHGHFKAIISSSIIQFGLKPFLAFGLASAFGLSNIIIAVITIMFLSPTAASSYILAKQLGGDTETMASIITFQTLIGFLLMPIIAHVLIG